MDTKQKEAKNTSRQKYTGTGCFQNQSDRFNKYMKPTYYDTLYLLTRKKTTYFSELRRLFGYSRNEHLQKLEAGGVVQRRTPSEAEWNFIKTNNKNLPNEMQEKAFIYEFTEEGQAYFLHPRVYNALHLLAKEGINEFIEEQKKEFEENREKQEEQARIQEQRIRAEARRRGAILPEDRQSNQERIEAIAKAYMEGENGTQQ